MMPRKEKAKHLSLDSVLYPIPAGIPHRGCVMRRWRKLPIVAAKVVLMAWLLGTVALWCTQDSFVFPAPTEGLGDPTEDGWPMFRREELATADGLRLAFWAAAPKPGRPGPIVFHGNGAQASWGAPYLWQLHLRHGLGVVLAEYRGYSGNPGRPSEAGLIEDGRAYARWVRERWGVELPVLLGESLGTGVAVALAAEVPTRGVVLDSPYTSLADVMASGPMAWAPTALLRHRFDSRSRIGAVRSPVMVLHGTGDWVIAHGQGRELLGLAPCPGPGLFPEGVAHLAVASNASGATRDAVVAFIDSLPAEGGCPAQ